MCRLSDLVQATKEHPHLLQSSFSLGRAAMVQWIATKGLCSCESQSKTLALYGVTVEKGVKKHSTSSIHARILVIFIQLSIKWLQANTFTQKLCVWAQFLCFDMCRRTIKYVFSSTRWTLLLLLCTHCLILQETFGLFASVYGKRTSILREREKRAPNWENAFSVSTTILIVLAVSLSNK